LDKVKENVLVVTLQHNGLGAEALALANDSRTDVSEAFTRVWKAGVKMRQFFLYGDVQQAHLATDGSMNDQLPSILERGPSIYSGAEDAVIARTSKEIVEKAQFLLSLDTPLRAINAAHQRWALMAKYGKAHAAGDNHEEKWAAVVNELHAAYKIKSMFDYRRKAAEKKRTTHRTITERLLRFLQAPAKIEEIATIKERRNRRAEYRADGINLLTILLGQSGSPASQCFLLYSFIKALREARHGKDASVSHVHYLNGVEGCSIECAARLRESFLGLLKRIVDILRTNIQLLLHNVKAGSKTNAEQQAKEHLVMTALKACALDFDVKDHETIEESDLINVLDIYLSCGNAGIRSTAWSLFEALLPRSSTVDEASVFDEPTVMSNHMLSLVVRHLESIAESSRTPRPPLNITPTVLPAGPKHVMVLEGATQLDRSTVGKVVPHLPLGLNNSMCMWLYRSKALVDEWADDSIVEGSRVIRGPDWNEGNQDVFDGNMGTVVKIISPTSVCVQWDGTDARYTYRWGLEEGGVKVFDLLVVDEGSGGSLVMKGASTILEPETQAPWSIFNLAITDAGRLSFSVAINEKDTFQVVGHNRITAETWCHVAVTVSKTAVALYLNGELDIEKVLDANLLHMGPTKKAVVEIESPHPYAPNSDDYWHIEVPDAESYIVSFSEQTCTERNYDFLRFYGWEDQTIYGEDKYTGGMNNTERTFPGLDGQPPLLINASRFRVFFHSDGSNQDYGFHFKAVAKLMDNGDGLPDNPIQDLNPHPLYIGQPPSYITRKRGALGMLARLAIFPDTLSSDDVKCQASRTDTSCLPASTFNEEKCLQVLSLLNKNVTAMPISSIRSLTTPQVIEAILRLSISESFSAKIASTRLCANILPFADPKMVDVQLARLSQSSLDAKPDFIWGLLRNIGEVMVSSFDNTRIPKAKDGAENAFALMHQRLLLLRSLSSGDNWCLLIKDAVLKVLNSVSHVIETLECNIKDELNQRKVEQPSNEQLLVFACMGLLGGIVGGISVGSEALVELEGKKGAFEEGTVVALTFAPKLDPEADRERYKRHTQTWEHLQGFGDAVVVVLHSEPTKTVIYPRTKLAPMPLKDSSFLSKITEDCMDLVLAAFKQILQVDVSPRLPCYLPQKTEEDRFEVIESDHPYGNLVDRRWKLDFPGAKQIEVTFDEQTRTDFNNDYVRFLKTDSGTEFWGEEKYHGRDRQQNWPGLQGRQPLIIPAPSCVVLFRTDPEETDWGFKLTARAHVVEVVKPPERPPLLTHVASLQLYMQGIKALSTVISNVPSMIKPASSALTQHLVKASLKPPAHSGDFVKRAEPLSLESKHPYDCNEDQYETISFPGAKKLAVVFDNQTASERGCDYLRFYKDDSRTEIWGESQYTGGKDGSSSNWPGVQGNPPLEIPSDHCVLYWHSDGSVVDWGWLVTFTPDYGKGKGMEGMATAEVEARIFSSFEFLYDQPRRQAIPDALKSFAIEAAKVVPDVVDDGLETSYQRRLRLEEEVSRHNGQVLDKNFVLNYRDAETAMVREKPSADAPVLAMLVSDQQVTVIGESRDWLQVKREGVEGWVLRRENDLIYLVPVDDNNDDLIVIPNEEGEEGGGGGGKNPMYECLDTVAASFETPPSAAGITPVDCLLGQSDRILNAMVESIQYGSIVYSKQSLTTLVLNWPDDQGFDVEYFGGPQQFLRFLRVCFEEEKYKEVNTSPRMMKLKQKILHVLRGSGEEAYLLAESLIDFSIKQLKDAVELHSKVKPMKGLVKCVETTHNYADNLDQYWPVSFPGAKRIKLVFDPRCSTEQNCDYVVIYKDSTHSSDARWTPVNYTGRAYDGPNKNWPGVDGRPPLYIESDHCEIHFHSDG